MLVANSEIVGVQLAFYAQRAVGGASERFCNIAAWCVLPQYRTHGLKLLKAVLAQKGYTFTDLSPSGNVVAVNQLLKFKHLDTGAALAFNWPWPNWPGRISIVEDRASIEAALGGEELKIYRDHADARAAHHLVIRRGAETCYVIFRRDTRKKLPIFASILFVSNPELFQAASRIFFSHLLTRHGLLATILEFRVVGYSPRAAFRLRSPRSKMFRSDHLKPDQIDYLYSELVSVPW
jgi:hypothetical protein